MMLCFFFFKKKTAYEMRISDWSSDVCSSDLRVHTRLFSEKPVVDPNAPPTGNSGNAGNTDNGDDADSGPKLSATLVDELATQRRQILVAHVASDPAMALDLTIFLMAQNVVFEQSNIQNHRSEEQKSELQSLMRIPYAVFCL